MMSKMTKNKLSNKPPYKDSLRGWIVGFRNSEYNTDMSNNVDNKLPPSLRPLVWGLKWYELNIDDDKEDIILGVINGGTIQDWKWLRSVYGKDVVRRVLESRLFSELYPESRNLAKIFFLVNSFRHARISTN